MNSLWNHISQILYTVLKNRRDEIRSNEICSNEIRSDEIRSDEICCNEIRMRRELPVFVKHIGKIWNH